MFHMAPRRVATKFDLLTHLAVSGVTVPGALRGALGGISPQTLSRLVADGGDEVCRIGRGRGTRYARTRSLEGLGHTLPTFRVDAKGQVTPAGPLHLLWGRQTFWQEPGADVVFEGLPPALVDMAPQGFIGRTFPTRNPGLGLPPRIADWSDDHRLIALARRGEDCVGDLIVGNESLQRFLASRPEDVAAGSYPAAAESVTTAPVGSSAGGERPKFGAFSRGRHVLVKFANATDEAGRRWRDLLWCELRALEVVATAGHPAAPARCFDSGDWRFLEVERFDRVGERGRRAVLSLSALNNEYFGGPDSWTAAAPLLGKAPFSLSRQDAWHLRWLDVYGQLIANSDRHFGNVAFFVSGGGSLSLAPAYDMLPMELAPANHDVVVRRAFVPEPPSGSTLDVWADAAHWARVFWRQVSRNEELSADVRAYATQADAAISALASRVTPSPSSSSSTSLPPSSSP